MELRVDGGRIAYPLREMPGRCARIARVMVELTTGY